MNSSPAEPNDLSSDTSSDSPTAPPEQTPDVVSEVAAEALAEVEATPPTRLLKRGDTPLFVPAILPDETASIETEGATSPENLAAIEPISVAEAPVAEAKSTAMPDAQSIAATVEFSPPPGTPFNASLTLDLRCAQANSSIRYALDAEDVDESGLLYDYAARIFLTRSTTVAARAFIDGKSGPLAVARFEIAQPGWQKIEPIDQSDPTTHEIRDETDLEGPWRLAGASVRGKLHAHRGGWREDAFRHGVANASDGTYSVVVVSDGAGSAPLSRVGSNLLCQTALDFLCFALAQSAPLAADSKVLVERDLPPLRALLVEAARLALQKVREEAAGRSREVSDFAATFLVLVRREWNGQQLCAALQAGDGGIALLDKDGALTLLGEADHGQQSGETRFITSSGMEAEFPARVKFSIRANLRATIVMTDGIADDYFPETQRLPDLFKTVLPLVESVENPGAALLDWIDYEKKGSADDRALVVCWRADMVPEASSAESASIENGSIAALVVSK